MIYGPCNCSEGFRSVEAVAVDFEVAVVAAVFRPPAVAVAFEFVVICEFVAAAFRRAPLTVH
jgi:hypothetical protein